MSHKRSWRKSTYSGPEIDSACVEVSLLATARPAAPAASAPAAFMPESAALVRDSKATGRDVLAFSTGAWRAFVESVA